MWLTAWPEAVAHDANAAWTLEKCEIADWGYSGYVVLEGCVCHWKRPIAGGLVSLQQELFMPKTPNAFAGESARMYIENGELREESGE